MAVGDEVVGAIDAGLLLLVGFGRADEGRGLESMAARVANLRVFADREGRFNHSLLDIEGAALLVPQFTLYADTRKGRRPDFGNALQPGAAAGLFNAFVRAMIDTGVARVETGRFGEHMQVELVNDGPVTIMLDQ